MKTAKSKKKWIILGIAALTVALAAVAAISLSGVTAESSLVEKGEVVRLVKETGTVESEHSVIVTAKNSGEVKELLAEEGDIVKAGAPLMEGDITSAEMDIKSLQSELSGLQVQYTRARSLANKNKTLYEQGALSREEYEASESAVKQLAAQMSSLSYSIGSSKESGGIAGVTAPIGGTITAVFIQKGENVTAGASLFEISDLNDLYVKVDLIAEDADLVREGDSARVFNDDSGFSDNGCTVRKIYKKAQEEQSDLGINQRRVTVEIALGTKGSLRLGSDMDVEITAEKKEAVLRVPADALFEKAGNDSVYVVESGKAVLRKVKTGLEGEDDYEILSGLKEGEIVIVSPGDEIGDGVKVQLKK